MSDVKRIQDAVDQLGRYGGPAEGVAELIELVAEVNDTIMQHGLDSVDYVDVKSMFRSRIEVLLFGTSSQEKMLKGYNNE